MTDNTFDPEEKRPYLDRYYVTRDGSVITAIASKAGPAGRYLLPSFSSARRGICYLIQEKKGDRAKEKTIRTIVRSVFGFDKKFRAESDFLRLRHKAQFENDALLGVLSNRVNPQEAIREKARQKPESGLSSCPFPKMQTMCQEFTSWDCPEMDPFSCGQWSVKIDV